VTWTSIIVLAAGAYLFKLAGLEGLGRLPVATRWVRLIELLPAALLAGLIVTQTVGPHDVVVDARLAGVIAGALLTATRRAPFIAVVVVSALVTAVVRAVS
jgi:branched-subunit amino acid transport protein